MPRPPIVTIIGTKKQGKTTLTVKLAAEMVRRGHRVMTMKHGSHTFNIDPSLRSMGLSRSTLVSVPDRGESSKRGAAPLYVL